MYSIHLITANRRCRTAWQFEPLNGNLFVFRRVKFGNMHEGGTPIGNLYPPLYVRSAKFDQFHLVTLLYSE